ncbi:MAG: tetratricopeptide repeat protein, partial [Verrucomicrobia bacterium]|nr:tetratricopeptide repeat protein [Verrucomicrobiota bacterium]
LLFAIHPVHCEAVCFISCRNVLVSGLFFFLSCWLYLKFARQREAGGTRYYVASLLCFLCAMLSKATSIALPLLLLLFAVFEGEWRRARPFLHLVPFFVLSAIFYFLFSEIALQARLIHEDILRFGSASLAAKAATAVQIPFFYLQKLLLPFGLTLEYDVRFAKSLGDPRVLAAAAGLAAMLAGAFVLRQRLPHLLLCLGWFLLALVPVLNFFPTNPVVADRYVYLPSFAFCYAVVACVAAVPARAWQYGAIACGIALAGFWSGMAFLRNGDWKSDQTISEAAIRTSPGALYAYINLGDAYLRQKNYDQALRMFEQAQKRNPIGGHYDYARGVVAFDRGDYRGAVDAFKAALANREFYRAALYGLGQGYEKLGEKFKAIQTYTKMFQSTELDPGGQFRASATERLNELRNTLTPQLDSLRSAVTADARNLVARAQLALTLDQLGLYEEALSHYLALERAGDAKWQVFYNAANIYKKTGRFAQAATYYEKSLARNPTHPDALNNLGLVCRNMHQYDRAIAAFEKAMAINKDYASAPFNLAVVYFRTGQRSQALQYFNYASERFPALRVRIKPYLRELR